MLRKMLLLAGRVKVVALKNISEYLLKPLTNEVNLSLSNDVFVKENNSAKFYELCGGTAIRPHVWGHKSLHNI